MMTDREIDLLAQRICFYAKNDDELLKKVAKFVKQAEKPENKLISLQEAAERLGISKWQLYRIKDDENNVPQFSYIKGESQSSPLKFNSTTIVDEYNRYLAKKKNKVVNISVAV